MTDDRRALVVNCGGVTLQLTVVDATGEVVADRYLDPWRGDTDQLTEIVGSLGRIDAVGHRFVHGGDAVTDAAVVDDDVVAGLTDAVPLAPLHQPRALAALAAMRALLDVPHVACVDTAFHRTIGSAAGTYALPAEWRERWPVLRRFGFHGFAHAHVARSAGELAGRPVGARIVSCHLGSGSSLCAIADGRSVDTTMGMTPSEGLVMVSRAGTIDHAIVTWLVGEHGLGPAEVADALDRRSGLVGLAGGSGDMREVLADRRGGDERAELAFAVYVHRLRREIGAMTATLGGVDVLAFTGGVGQHLPEVRAAAVDGLGHLGVAIDPGRNRQADSDADITAPSATCSTVVVANDEHSEIAATTLARTRPGAAPPAPSAPPVDP